MMLLLHQQRYAEAIQQLRGHLAAFGPLPDGLPLAAAAAHYGWLSRQYQCAAEMVATSRVDEAVLQANKDIHPCHLLSSAAQLAISRKAAAEQLAVARAGEPPLIDASAVRKGRYLGQLEMRRAHGAAASRDMTDAEFCLYLESEERRINHSQLALDLLLQAQLSHLKQASKPITAAPGHSAAAAAAKAAHAAADRLQARLAWQIAEQHVDTHNLTAARKLLMQAVHMYRMDGWDTLLLYSLLLLRDVCQRLKLHREALLHSLELCCLAICAATPSSSSSSSSSSTPRTAAAAAAAGGLADPKQALAMAAAALAGMLKGPVDKRSGIMKAGGASSSPSGSPGIIDGQPSQQQQLAGSSSPIAAAALLGTMLCSTLT
ncbi:Foie gras liver health family 1-domain-containing protein [Scenedesmus sp. NREL 46B-D3]|nr:Foie gras liver health family 1-domain-containing protein [Scenedesmus sp. NREL 46B-D3]